MNEKIFESLIISLSVLLPGSIITLLINKIINDTLKKLDIFKSDISTSILNELNHIKDKLELRFMYIEKRIDTLEETNVNNKSKILPLKIDSKTCLIVDDNIYQRTFLKDIIKLNFDNILIYEADTYINAIKLIETVYFNIAIIDYDLKDINNGLDVIIYCKDNNRLILRQNGTTMYRTILYTALNTTLTLPIGTESCILQKVGSDFSMKLLIEKMNFILNYNQ
jgi:hypothetical protein